MSGKNTKNNAVTIGNIKQLTDKISAKDRRMDELTAEMHALQQERHSCLEQIKILLEQHIIDE